ncbi:hypothetical protein DA099_03570 [Photobacterium damselae]|uniref:Uncharacterized protein n=1 Tax=Photobacterium damselae TaxID=38293 RepID=A0ACD3SUA9_PHODM|nr:hypothetical protein DA099_03570 [Photobacterium damselae]TMX62819.1 hypothetical protein DA090_17815 [Photobacterium damselae]TMX70728.1 hypothetical protein DA092_20430 [Photobacterium damselae]
MRSTLVRWCERTEAVRPPPTRLAIYSIGLNYHRYVSVTWVYIPLLQQFLFQKFDSITVDVKIVIAHS